MTSAIYVEREILNLLEIDARLFHVELLAGLGPTVLEPALGCGISVHVV
jgi:hypothetical protein